MSTFAILVLLSFAVEQEASAAPHAGPSPMATLPAGMNFTRIRFSPDGKTMATIEGPATSNFPGGVSDQRYSYNVRFWDVATGAEKLGLHGHFEGFQFSPDSKKLIVWTSKQVNIMEVATATTLATLDHENVRSVCFLSDGNQLVTSAGATGLFDYRPIEQHFWDMKTGARIHMGVDRFTPLFYPIFSPDGKLLAAFTSQAADNRLVPHELKIWEVATGKELKDLPSIRGSSSCPLGFTHDGKAVVLGPLWREKNNDPRSASPNYLDLASKQLVQFPQHLNPYEHVRWDGLQLYDLGQYLSHMNIMDHLPNRRPDESGGIFPQRSMTKSVRHIDNKWVVWDAIKGGKAVEYENTSDIHPGPGESMPVLPNDLMVAYQEAPTMGEANLWDVKSRKPIGKLETGRPIRWMTLAPNGTTLAVLSCELGGDNSQVTVWNLQKRKLIYSLKGHFRKVGSIAFSPDGRFLTTGSGSGSPEYDIEERGFLSGEVKLWDAKTGSLVRTLVEQSKHLFTKMVFRPDGKQLAAENAGHFCLWNTTTGELERELHIGLNNCFAYSPDGKNLAVSSGSRGHNDVSLWDLDKGECTLRSTEQGSITSIEFSADGKSLILGGSRFPLYLAAMRPPGRSEAPYPPRRMKEPDWVGPDHGFGVSAQTDTLLAIPERGLGYAYFQGVIGLWEAGTRKASYSLKTTTGEIRTLLLTPDKKTLLAGGDAPRTSMLKLIDLNTGAQVAIVTDILPPCFSPGGDLVATRDMITGNDEVTLRKSVTGKILATFSHAGMHSVHFSPNGKVLATVGEWHVKLWDLAKFSAAQ